MKRVLALFALIMCMLPVCARADKEVFKMTAPKNDVIVDEICPVRRFEHPRRTEAFSPASATAAYLHVSSKYFVGLTESHLTIALRTHLQRRDGPVYINLSSAVTDRICYGFPGVAFSKREYYTIHPECGYFVDESPMILLDAGAEYRISSAMRSTARKYPEYYTDASACVSLLNYN